MTKASQDEVPLLVHGRTWEDMPAGSAFRTAKRTITETDLVGFLHISGINEPLFYDAGHAASAGYAGRLVPGALVYVFAEGLILQTNVLHGTGLAFMSMEYSIKSPTFVGDTIHVVVEVEESRVSSRGGRGVVRTRCGIVNQHGDEVAYFTPVRLIPVGTTPSEVVPMNDAVIVEKDGPVRVLTLNRPDAMNAFDDELHGEFPAALRALSDDRNARAVVLTGAGRAFSAGGNIDDFEVFRTDFEARRRILRQGRQLFDDLLNVHLPVVAAVNGPAVGLGCTIVTACDYVLMSEQAFLADPHVQVALVAGDGGAVTWPLNIGLLRAKPYLLTGERVPAEVAVQLGLATRVVPHDELLTEARAVAHKIAALPPQAVQDTKMVLNQHLRQSAVSLLGFGLAAESQSHDTAEYRAVPEQFRARKK